MFNETSRRSTGRERIIKRRVEDSHEIVLNSFQALGVRIGPIPLLVREQDILKYCYVLERNALGLYQDSQRSIDGIYSSLYDTITLDREMVEFDSIARIDHVLTHEYAHRLFRKVMSPVEKGENKNNFKRLPYSRESTLVDPEKRIREHIKLLQGNPLTSVQRNRLNLDLYFEEMFAESVALSMTRNPNGDMRWFEYSTSQQKGFLKEDGQFAKKLEEVLYNMFFERFFRMGLKQVSLELPALYDIVRNNFEVRNRALLQNPKTE